MSGKSFFPLIRACYWWRNVADCWFLSRSLLRLEFRKERNEKNTRARPIKLYIPLNARANFAWRNDGEKRDALVRRNCVRRYCLSLSFSLERDENVNGAARRTKATRAFNEKLCATEAQSCCTPALELLPTLRMADTRGLWRCSEFFDDLYMRRTLRAQLFRNVSDRSVDDSFYFLRSELYVDVKHVR